MGDEEPVLRVVRGTPTAEELAALVGVLRGRAHHRPPEVSAPTPWVRSGRPGAVTAGPPRDRGRHAWRVSALPR